MPMGKKEARDLAALAREALKASRMERADFGEGTEDIKEATRLYRDSWITCPLQKIVTALEAHS